MSREDILKAALMGRKIVEASIVETYPGGDAHKSRYWEGPFGVLTLDDGTLVVLRGNSGCGGCPAGAYYLEHLAEVDNIITNVVVDEAPVADDDPCTVCGVDTFYCVCKDGPTRVLGSYRIFVFADNTKINVAEFNGTDGNGYYGTGFWIDVIEAVDQVSA